MVMFGQSSSFRSGSLFGTSTTTNTNHNPVKDVEVSQPPDDSIQVLKFSPPAVATNFLASGSWDNIVRVWEVKGDGSTEPKAQQSAQGPILGIDWSEIFIASADKTVRVWDLASNQIATLGQHDAPVKTCHFIKATNYTAIMTGSWDKTIKVYPMAVVGTAGRQVKIYRLDNSPSEVKQMESPLKFQHRCVSIFRDRPGGSPTGFALGSIEGRVAIQYVEAANPKDNFTFKCHRSPDLVNGFQDIYAVNDIAFHPVHNTLSTVGSDGRFSYWDKDARTKLKTIEPSLPSPITACAFNKGGEIFAYSSSYDWSKGHEFYKPEQKNYIFIHPCFDELKPRPKTK